MKWLSLIIHPQRNTAAWLITELVAGFGGLYSPARVLSRLRMPALGSRS